MRQQGEVAERVGFEPTVGETPTSDFESDPFSRSGTSPHEGSKDTCSAAFKQAFWLQRNVIHGICSRLNG